MDGSKCWLSSQDLPFVSTHFYMGSIHPKVTSEIVMPRAPPQWPSSYLSFASVPVVKVTSRCQGQSNLGNAASNLEESQTDSDSLFESLWRVKSDLSKVPDVDPCRHRHSQLNQWLHDYFEHYECIIFDEFIHGDVRSWASSQQLFPDSLMAHIGSHRLISRKVASATWVLRASAQS